MYFENCGPPLTSHDIDRVEKLIGCQLPASYRDLLLKHNGGTPRPSGFEVWYAYGPATDCVEMLHSINRGTAGNDLETAIRSDQDARQSHEQFEIPADAIWIGAAMGGEIVLFVKGLRAGQVWIKAGVEDHGNPMEGMSYLAAGFDEFLAKLTPCEWDGDLALG
jgi:hypothetical protein